MTKKNNQSILVVSISLLIMSVVMFENSYIFEFAPIIFLFTTALCLFLNRYIRLTKDKEVFVIFLFSLYSVLLQDYSNGLWSSMGLKQMPTTIMICLFVFYVIYSLPTDNYDNVKKLVRALTISSIGLCLIVIVLLHFNPFKMFQEESIRLLKQYGYNRNSLGERLCLSALILISLEDRKTTDKVMFCILCLFSLLTGSRTVVITYIGFILGYVFAYLKRKRRFVAVGVSVIIISILIMRIPFFYSIIGYRFESAINAIELMISGKTITETRLRMIVIGWEYFKESPIIGNGWASFANRYSYINDQAAVFSHNNYIELLCNSGIIGCVLYYLRYIFAVVKIFPYKGDRIFAKYMGLIWAVLFMDLSAVTYYYKFYYIYLAIVLLMIKTNLKYRIQTNQEKDIRGKFVEKKEIN